MGLPEIRVEFKKLAESASVRSTRGILAVILRDTTAGVTWTKKTYAALSDVTQADFSAANYKILARAFLASPFLVRVIRVGANGTVADAAQDLESAAYNWVCTPVAALQSELAAYVKTVNTARRLRQAKCLVYGVTGADDIHVVSAANASVTLTGESDATAMTDYLPRLAAVLAACPITGSVTYYALEDVVSAAAVTDPGASVDAGNLVIFQEDTVWRIARGVTTLQTVTGDLTEDMKKISVVEAMDMMKEDISLIFKNHFMSRVRNSADNQALFLSEVRLYLQDLQAQSVLDPDTEPTVEIDVAAMRRAWTAAGTDVASLSDAQVRKKTFRSYLYAAMSCRVLDAVEDLIMTIGLG